jgi:hypothetical protein
MSDEYRDDMDFGLQGLGDLGADEVAGLLDAAVSLVVCGAKPTAPDHSQENIALRDRLTNGGTIVIAGANGIDVHEDERLAEMQTQSVIDLWSIAAAVFAPVVDEDAGQAHAP